MTEVRSEILSIAIHGTAGYGCNQIRFICAYTKDMNQQALLDESPKIFRALARFLNPAELAIVGADYQHVRQCGGNIELGLTREQGVSYNPPLARLLSIVSVDLGIQDLLLIRTTLYAAVLLRDGLLELISRNETALHELQSKRITLEIPGDIKESVQSACDPSCATSAGCVIRGVLALDTIRHLHQTSWSLADRQRILEDVERNVVEPLIRREPEILVKKLSHAITLQRRRLRVDRSRM